LRLLFYRASHESQAPNNCSLSQIRAGKNKTAKKGLIALPPKKLPAVRNIRGGGLEHAMNGQYPNAQQNRRDTAANTDTDTNMAMPMAAAARDMSSSVGRPPSHYFSNNYNENHLLSQQRQRWDQSSPAAGMAAYNMPMPAASITAASRHGEEELMRLRRMGGGVHLGAAAAAAAWAHTRVFPPMGVGRLHTHPMMVGVGSFKEDDTEFASLRTESIEHIISLQEAQARRRAELEQLRQLGFMQAVNQRRIEEDMMLAEQQHPRQFYYPTPHALGAGRRSGSSDDELKIRQARVMQLQSMPTSELLSRVGTQLRHSQLQGGFHRDCSDGNISSGAATTSERAAAPIGHNDFRQIRPVSATAPPPPPPPLRYWNNGVEVDIRGVPMTPSPFNKFNSSNSAASASSRPSTLNDNIISRFSTLVISCVPEVDSAISDLLSNVKMIRGFPSDPLIVRSKFPGFVEAASTELKSLGERTKDKELHERVMNCIDAIEPYKKMAELDAPSDYSKIRSIVEEGMGLAIDLMSNDPSERRAHEKRKKEKTRKRMGIDSSDSKNAKRRKPSLSKLETITILDMYKKHKSSKANESEEKNESSDGGTSNVKKIEGKKTLAMVSNSSHSDTTTGPKEDTSQRSLEKSRTSDDNSKQHPKAKSKAIVEQGPHGDLLHQIFGRGHNDGESGDTCSSAKVNAAGVGTTSNQVFQDQKKKKADDNTVNFGHLSVVNVLLGLGGKQQQTSKSPPI